MVAKSGKYAGTEILRDEARRGLAMVNALTEAQRGKAVLNVSKPGNNILTQAWSDNVVLDYAGVRGTELNGSQREQLLALIEQYVGNMREGHAAVRMAEVKAHLDRTYFAWIGKTDADAVFYYRVHSPVLLIEFDHQTPVGLRHIYPPGVPFREHHVEMLFDRALLPLYGWLFPEGNGRVNIGIAYEDPKGKKNARDLFRSFLDRNFADLKAQIAACVRGANELKRLVTHCGR